MVFRYCMALRALFLLLLALAHVASSSVWDSGAHWHLAHFSTLMQNNGLDAHKTCDGLVGDCIKEDQEMMMDSEVSRRGLAITATATATATATDTATATATITATPPATPPATAPTTALVATTPTEHFISYDALKQNLVPCNRRGDSYYNCHLQRRETVNPYKRSCTIITRCTRLLDD